MSQKLCSGAGCCAIAVEGMSVCAVHRRFGQCATCGGSGKCSSCHGVGVCADCNFSGECIQCQGRGIARISAA